MRKLITAIDVALRRYTPDPFVIALLLTLVTVVSALLFTPSVMSTVVSAWGDSLWALKEFTLQMAMVLVSGYALASSRPVTLALDRLSRRVHTPNQALVMVSIISVLTFMVNWGLGLVVTGFLCRQLGARVKKLNYPLLVASGYGGFVVWHGGFSGSIPLLLATPGNFTEKAIGRVIPIRETLFAPYNLFFIASVLVTLPLLAVFLGKISKTRSVSIPPEVIPPADPAPTRDQSPAERLERSRLLPALIITLAVLFFIDGYTYHGKRFTLDHANMMALFLAFLLHGTPRKFMNAMYEGAKNAGPILLQFPLYGGIMGILTGTTLGPSLSHGLSQLASQASYPLYTFLSSAFVNLLVPSGGGQWAVQGPIVLQSAQALGADVGKAAMAVAWGGTWTDLLQPFWAVPILSIAGLHLREVIGYLLVIFMTLGLILIGTFAFI